MPYKFSMIFLEYLRILGTENTAGGASTRPRERRPPYRARPLSHGPLVAPSTYASTHTLHLLPKKSPSSSSTSSSSFCCDFDLRAQSSIHKTALGDCCLVCDSSIGPISFCSSALFIANFCFLGDPVLELACQIYMVEVVLMYDIGFRHL